MRPFQVDYYPRAKKDLEKLRDNREARILIDSVEAELGSNPFPQPPGKKRIQGMSQPLFRLQIDTARDGYRIFYLFEGKIVTVLRIIKKKDAGKIIRSFR